jgi:hypothetical protein
VLGGLFAAAVLVVGSQLAADVGRAAGGGDGEPNLVQVRGVRRCAACGDEQGLGCQSVGSRKCLGHQTKLVADGCGALFPILPPPRLVCRP